MSTVLYRRVAATLSASDEGLLFSGVSAAGADAEAEVVALGVDARILLEQGLAEASGEDVLLPWACWQPALELGLRSLTEHSSPSPFLLEVDRLNELGRANFRYVLRWYDGANQIAVSRSGAFIKASGDRLYHLDGRTLAIAQAAEGFNDLPPNLKSEPRRAFAALAELHANSDGAAAMLERHLRSNLVVVPTSLGLRIREEADGAVTFLPSLPSRTESDAFAKHFESTLDVQDVQSLTMEGGRRVRVLLSEEQKEVLERMRKVRRLQGADAVRIRENPAALFDGLTDVIDLSSIDREYGPRVLGVGPIELASDIKVEGGKTMLSRMGQSLASGTDESAVPETPPPPRAAVAVDLLNADSGMPETIRMKGEAEVAAVRDAVHAALEKGEDSFEFDGRRFRAEPALEQVLDRHVAPELEHLGDDGVVGSTGHLYLLINVHEQSLTDALVVSPDAFASDCAAIPAVPPASLSPNVSLQQHQLEGLSWLATLRTLPKRRGAVLADDMGLGKTLQLLSHIASLIESNAMLDPEGNPAHGPWRPVLIIAPLILVDTATWTNEMAARFSEQGRIFEPWVVLRGEGLRKVRMPEGGADFLGKPLLDPARLMSHKVVITTYETLLAYQHSLAQRVDGRPMWSLVIFDEAQEIKSPRALVSHAAKALDASHKIVATGTPVETRLRDLWNLLDTVEPTYLGTQREFVTTFERPAMNGASDDIRRTTLDDLRSRLKYRKPDALILRRDKSILTSLPKKIDHRITCELTDLEREISLDALSELRRGGGGRIALRVLHRLHMASQHPVLAGAAGDAYDTAFLIKSSSRLQALINSLDNVRALKEKALIFVRSVEAQRMLAKVVSEYFRIPVDVINGETGIRGGSRGSGVGNVRRGMLDRFQSSPGFGAIVLSPFVAGVGLTITAANHVIHYGRWWNPAVEGQATDRAYRIGQTKDVHVYFPIAVDSTGAIEKTFDEALDDLIQSRKALASDFLQPHSEDGDGALLARTLGAQRLGKAIRAGEISAAARVEHQAAVTLEALLKGGFRCAWLGIDGQLGAHILAADGHAIYSIRFQRETADDLIELASTAASRWSRRLVSATVTPLAVNPNGVVTVGANTGPGKVVREAELTTGPLRTVTMDVVESAVTVKTLLRIDGSPAIPAKLS